MELWEQCKVVVFYYVGSKKTNDLPLRLAGWGLGASKCAIEIVTSAQCFPACALKVFRQRCANKCQMERMGFEIS